MDRCTLYVAKGGRNDSTLTRPTSTHSPLAFVPLQVPPLSAPMMAPPTPHRMERLARQNSRREEKERAEGEMEKLAPDRQRVEAQKVARDQAREEAKRAKRARPGQAVLEARRLAGLEWKERGRLGGTEGPPRGITQQAVMPHGGGEQNLMRAEEKAGLEADEKENGGIEGTVSPEKGRTS